MRTIKFRGKFVYKNMQTGENDWVYGDLVQYPEHIGKHRIVNEGINREVLAYTVGQFTGLHDKNGREIYEGDIVYSEFEDGSNGSSLVGWNEKQSCFGVMDEYAYCSKLEGFEYPAFQNSIMIAFMRDAKLFEVIGNIHDNPELLKIMKQ